MKKYGEIIRFHSNGFLYIVSIEKIEAFHLSEFLHVPYFCISISAKTAKKIKNRKYDKDHLHFQLLNQGFASYFTIRRVEREIKNYLDTMKPECIAFSAFRDNRWVFEKRIKFYIRRLQMMGYEVDHVDKEHWDDPVYFMKRLHSSTD